MDFDGGAAVGAGLIGRAVMGMLLYMGIGMMPWQIARGPHAGDKCEDETIRETDCGF